MGSIIMTHIWGNLFWSLHSVVDRLRSSGARVTPMILTKPQKDILFKHCYYTDSLSWLTAISPTCLSPLTNIHLESQCHTLIEEIIIVWSILLVDIKFNYNCNIQEALRRSHCVYNTRQLLVVLTTIKRLLNFQ